MINAYLGQFGSEFRDFGRTASLTTLELDKLSPQISDCYAQLAYPVSEDDRGLFDLVSARGKGLKGSAPDEEFCPRQLAGNVPPASFDVAV